MDDDSVIVNVDGLTFTYPNTENPVFKDITFELKRGTRTVLVGGNGAGKTTMLRVCAGKHLVGEKVVTICGRSAFHDTSLNNVVAYMGDNTWKRDVSMVGYGVPFTGGFPARHMWESQKDVDQDRLEELLKVLRINPDWHMAYLSDGQRRRMQLLLKLLTPFTVLFLDEVTVDLDVLARKSLLQYLERETNERGVTVLYATHIFDGLEDWATDILYLSFGKIHTHCKLLEEPTFKAKREAGESSALLKTVEDWLTEEQRQVN